MKRIKPAFPPENDSEKTVRTGVREIIQKIRTEGDSALNSYNAYFDKCQRKNLRVSPEEIEKAGSLVDPDLLAAMKSAADNIRTFAQKQMECILPLTDFEVQPGIYLGHRIIPVQSCCCYVPGGGYPLYSTALMLGIPASVAGVPRIAACSPAMKGTESIHPAVLCAMDLAGIHEIYVMGGAQAVAAVSWGTESILPVDIVVGPGNQYVTEAKRQCYGQTGIDFIAGPSEVLVLCDETANPAFIAADLLAQSEHDTQARGIVVTTNEAVALEIFRQVNEQLKALPTRQTAERAWRNNGEIILADSLEEACAISNRYAPEHLEVHLAGAEEAVPLLTNYGSLFLGSYAAEVFGDYASGTNHTLPTARAARYTGGVSVGTFLKICTTQRMTPEGVDRIGNATRSMALGEGLHGHAAAVQIRMDEIQKEK